MKRGLLPAGIAVAVLELSSGVALGVLGALDRLPPGRARLTPENREELARIVAGDAPYVMPDPRLGWTLRPHGERSLYRANGQGLRAEREYAADVPPGGWRIGAFGDSFTHGDGVTFHETWTAQLAGLVAGLEVLNFGVPAYGPDQAYLRYEEEARRFALPMVLFGIMTVDEKRTVNVFRPFLRPGGMPLSKPRFAWVEGGLELLPNPLRSDADYLELRADEGRTLARLGERDYFYRDRIAPGTPPFPLSLRLLLIGAHELWGRANPGRPFAGGRYNVRSEAYRITRALCERLAAAARSRGAEPVILLFPAARDIRDTADGQSARYAPLLHDLAAAGLRVHDLAPPLAGSAASPSAELFEGTGHYNAAGNAIVARSVLGYLRGEGLLP